MEVKDNVASSVTVKDGIASKVTMEYVNGELKVNCAVVFVDDLKRTSQQSASDGSAT